MGPTVDAKEQQPIGITEKAKPVSPSTVTGISGISDHRTLTATGTDGSHRELLRAREVFIRSLSDRRCWYFDFTIPSQRRSSVESSSRPTLFYTNATKNSFEEIITFIFRGTTAPWLNYLKVDTSATKF